MIDLSYSEEQALLVSSAAKLLDRYSTVTDVRRAEAHADGYDRALWLRMAELGWAGLLLPSSYGGSDQGLVELCLIAEQLGLHACSSPLLDSTLLVSLPLLWAGTPLQKERWLPELAAGVIGTLGVIDGGRDEWSAPELSGSATSVGWFLSGAKSVVPFAATASLLVVAADLEGVGTSLVLLDPAKGSFEVKRLRTFNPEPLFRVFIETEVTSADILGAATESTERVLRRALDHATVAWVAYAAGVTQRALEMSVRHASDRQQFGRPVGTFQAVAHRLADMRADIDGLRLLAYQAAWKLDHAEPCELEVAASKAFASDAVRRIFVHAHQVHGAIGFSTEHDLQLFSRRGKAFELTLGGSDHHRERVALAMGLRPAVPFG